MKQIGFLENSLGEKSSTKLLKMIVFLIVIIVWAILSVKNNEMLKLDPYILGLLGVLVSGNGFNKWTELNNNKIKPKNQIKD